MTPGSLLSVDPFAEHALNAFIVFTRVGAFFAFLPGFGEMAVPSRVKIGLSCGVTIAVWSVVEPSLATPNDLNFVGICIRELLLGLALGVFLRSYVFVLQIAGSMIAQSTSLAQLAGASVEPMPAIGQFLLVAALALAMLLGLPARVIEFLVLSYAALPPLSSFDPSALLVWGADILTAGFALAFTLASPFLALSFLYNLTLGAISRAMPQLMVALVGAPMIIGVTLLFMYLFTPALLARSWSGFLELLVQSGGVFP